MYRSARIALPEQVLDDLNQRRIAKRKTAAVMTSMFVVTPVVGAVNIWMPYGSAVSMLFYAVGMATMYLIAPRAALGWQEGLPKSLDSAYLLRFMTAVFAFMVFAKTSGHTSPKDIHPTIFEANLLSVFFAAGGAWFVTLVYMILKGIANYLYEYFLPDNLRKTPKGKTINTGR